MQDKTIAALQAGIVALEGQRATLGDAVLDLAIGPLRAQLASLLRPAGLQHRQVTVVFADVVGAAALAQGTATEDTLAVLSAALRRMADIVQAHQGRVLRFTGDGVKAAFGMDETREDDAERAVRAGLAMLAAGREQADAAQRRHGIDDFAVRVGLHTGDVALGAGVEADNTAMGAAVNIAARMEQTAPPGTLRISHDTWSLVRGLFELEAQPPLEVKGVAAPMQTYLVRAALERSAASVDRGLQGLRTPMIGRRAELQRLQDAVAGARGSRQLHALTLLGNAGLGKSRLLREFTAALLAQGTDCRVLTLRSQPDGLLRLFGLLRTLLATQCGTADTDSAELARRKVVDGLSPWFDEGGDAAQRQAQLIGQLAGLDFADSPTVKGLDPRSLRDQAFAALRSYLRALAARGALPVLLVEDLHWADDGSLDLLQHLQAHAAELPLALVMTARPALLTRRPDWATPDATVPLSPLATADSDTLAAALLHRVTPLPPRLTELIVGRAEGNPYYMEELVRRLIDDGVIVVGDAHWTVQADRLDTLRLPTTLVGLLQARLDALPASERQAARHASIVGHVFWDEALQALDARAPQALPALQRAAFVKDRDSSDFEGTPERQFDHHLLHQVTYDTLLKAERKLGHGAAARWLAERTQGRGAEFLAMTGEHAERAGDTALAIDCFEQAGTEARKRFANAAALSWLGRAVSLLGEDNPGRRFDLLLLQEGIGEHMGDRSVQDACHSAMESMLQRHPDDARLARLLVCRALLAERRGDRPACERLAQQAAEVAEPCAEARAAAKAHHLLAWVRGSRGDYAGARVAVEQSLSWVRRIEDESVRESIEAASMIMAATVASYFDEVDKERAILQQVLTRAEARGAFANQADALLGLIELEHNLGFFEQAAALAQRMLTLARSTGYALRTMLSLFSLGEAARCMGDHAAAIDWYGQCLPMARATGNRRREAMTLLGLGVATLGRGDAAGALQWHAQALEIFEQVSSPNWAAENQAHHALCQARLGHQDAAVASASRVLDRLQGDGDLAQEYAERTITLRWYCHQVLAPAGDARAGALLAQLHADVQEQAAVLNGAADRERVIQAVPEFRGVVAAYQRLHGEPTSVG